MHRHSFKGSLTETDYTLATFHFGSRTINDVHRYLTSPHRRGRIIYRLNLVFWDPKDWDTFYDSYDELFSEFTFKSISFFIDAESDHPVRHIRMPASLKTFGLDIMGGLSKALLDWSSFSPFLRKSLKNWD